MGAALHAVAKTGRPPLPRHPAAVPRNDQSSRSAACAQDSYRGGSLQPSQLIRELHPLLAGQHGSFVALGTLDDLLRRAECVP